MYAYWGVTVDDGISKSYVTIENLTVIVENPQGRLLLNILYLKDIQNKISFNAYAVRLLKDKFLINWTIFHFLYRTWYTVFTTKQNLLWKAGFTCIWTGFKFHSAEKLLAVSFDTTQHMSSSTAFIWTCELCNNEELNENFFVMYYV